jgi:excisionase family DNA binding protein
MKVATKNPTVEPLAARVRTAARMLDCSPSQVYELVRVGKLAGFSLGDRGLRIPLKAIHALLEQADSQS